MSYIGSNSIGKLFLGTTEIAKAYLGTQLVYQSGPVGPRLPSGYTEVEYIENTSNARINTGVTGVSTWSFAAQLVTNNGGSTSCVAIGRYTSGSHFFGATGSNHYWGFGTSSGQYVSVAATTKAVISITFASSTSISGTVDGAAISRSGGASSSNQVYLFNCTSSSTYPFKGRIFGDVIGKNNGNEVFHGIPCIDPNNVVGLYDKVTDTFFSSTNSSVFIAGPVVN